MTAETLLQRIDAVRQEALASLEALSNGEQVEEWRVAHLGRRGALTLALRDIGTLPAEARPEAGVRGQQGQNWHLEEGLAQKLEALRESEAARLASEDQLDVTLPGRPMLRGRLHPTSQIVRQICDAFVSMGFQVVEGPEVEWDRYNFELLNIPRDHPARDMWNTLWIDQDNEAGQYSMLLRTHTSPMQARVMESMQPPVSESSYRASAIGMRRRMRRMNGTSTKWKAWQWTMASPSPT